MALWNEGYVADVSYTTGFYRELAPSWIATGAMLLGHRAPVRSGRFRYAELGCGHGLNPIVFAACHPEAEFWGFDFNPSHIEGARRLAAAAGLGNAHFAEASFAELAAGAVPELGQFDYITLHGIWSWVSAENRARMVAFIARHLAPGGVVYVSYNNLAGWASMLPVQRMMRLLAGSQGGTSQDAAARALAAALELARSDAVFFAQNPTVLTRLESAAGLDGRYLAHEYMNADWEPVTFDEVSGALAGAKCGYVGSATLTDNIDGVAVPGGVARMLTQVTDPRLREAIRDLGAGRSFRRDLYRRGTDIPPQGEHLALLDAMMLTGLGREHEEGLQIATGVGHVSPRAEIYGPVLRRLAEGPMSFAELRRLGPLDGQPMSEVLQVLAFLLTGGLALPSLDDGARRLAEPTTQALNRQIGRANGFGANIVALASPVLGTAVTVDIVETLLVAPMLDGETGAAALVDHVLAALATAGRSVLKDGTVVTDPDMARDVMATTVARILRDRAPLLRRLGILPEG